MDIADGNHRLVGEGLQQCDLLVAEGLNLGTAQRDHADALALAQERHAQDGAMTHPKRHIPAFRELVALGLQIADVNGLSVNYGPPGRPIAANWPFTKANWHRSVVGAEDEVITLPEADNGIIGIAQLAGTFSDRL